jgi:hypothetical protein
MSTALDQLIKQLGDVDNLKDHHRGSGERGRPTEDEGPLNRSCVVLTYAAWEVYVEDSLIAAASALAKVVERYRNLPSETQSFISESVKDAGELADDGWKQILVDAATILVRGDPDDKYSFGLNTADPHKVMGLHDKVLGYRILNSCNWSGMSAENTKKKLAKLVSDRGSIVHTGTNETVKLTKAKEYRKFVEKLSKTYDKELNNWLSGYGASLA